MNKRLAKNLKTTVKLVLFVALGVAGWYAYTVYVPEVEEDGLGELPTAVAAIKDITVSVQATGVLQPIKVVEIKSKASGEILEMPVEMGDFVQAGDLIAQVDTKIIDQEIKQVEADHASAVVRLDIAKSQYARAQSLFAQDLISENELESSQQSFSNAEGQMLRAEATLDLARERLADATVRAPSSGTIISKAVEEGQIIASSTNNVSGGTTLVQMADLSQLEIRTLVDEVDIGQVRPGLPVDSKVEAFAAERFDGAVVKIEPQAVVQQSVTTFPVLSRIDNADGKLLPGMNADVSIVVHRKPGVVAIPNEAVRTPSDAAEVKRILGLGSDASGGGASGAGSVGSRGGARDGASADASGTRMGARGNTPGGSSADAGASRGGSANMSPAERARMIAARRVEVDKPDDDPFGIGGRREDASVFVYDALGRITTRSIVVGVRDWENTEVIEGLDPGDEVLLLPSTSLLRSQDRLRTWAQGRSGIPGMGGSGGPPPGMGRGRGR